MGGRWAFGGCYACEAVAVSFARAALSLAIIASLVESGMAVILISSDLEEVMNLSHSVALYRDGRILQIGDAAGFTMEKIMEQLTGAVQA